MLRLPLSILFLLLAWCCANRPQAIVFAVADWIQHAERFSHQEQMAERLRARLARASEPARDTAVAAAPDKEPRNHTPPVPAPSLPRIELSLWTALEMARPAPSEASEAGVRGSSGRRPREVPVPPPRRLA